MFGPFTDPRVAVGVGNAFGDAARRVHERRRRSMARHDQLGTSERIETSDTDDLIDDFETAVQSSVGDIRKRTVGEGVEMEIEFHPTNVAGEEREFGADFGVRVHIEGPNYNVSKGLLFQCKRMYGPEVSPTFDELRGRGEDQAGKMLSLTPASFFLLFNSVGAERTWQWIKPPAGLYPFYREFGPWPFPWPEFWRFPRKALGSYSVWDTGVMVLPAARVYAESRVCRRQGVRLPIQAEHWIAGALPLGVFMADALGSCFVGDVRESILRIVTPPKLRELASGLPDFDPSTRGAPPPDLPLSPGRGAVPTLLTATEVARLLRVHRNTVDRERRSGALACVRIGRRVLFTEDQVRDYIVNRSDRED